MFTMKGGVTMKEMIDELLRRGVSKYKIAKKVGVSWNTVQLWHKGIYQPRVEHLEKLKELLNEEKVKI